MKNIKKHLTVALFSLSTIVFIACNSNSNKSNNSNSGNSNSNSSKQMEQTKVEDAIDGVYSGSQNISGLELVAKLTISGSRWSATSQLGYDSPEYQNGVVKGNDLFDDSGMIKIGYVSGNSASINGYPSMRK
ncbi:MAG: hypothetical protein FJX80_10230 [Bacteroidetes bacterium]|nr:hypothetical protein [Bacteroidota bacterium]